MKNGVEISIALVFSPQKAQKLFRRLIVFK